MSKKKQKKAFLQTNTGRLFLTIVVLIIATAFVMSLVPRNSSSRDTEREKAEWQDVQLGMETMMDESQPPIDDLKTDQRIANFASTEDQATYNMTDGGLIDIDDIYIKDGSIPPLDSVIGIGKTDYQYWIEANGKVHQLVE